MSIFPRATFKSYFQGIFFAFIMTEMSGERSGDDKQQRVQAESQARPLRLGLLWSFSSLKGREMGERRKPSGQAWYNPLEHSRSQSINPAV